MTLSHSTPPPGRPREFDSASVLDIAVSHFSAYGYHGTSISDLNQVLGLSSGSIYKAWGDKRGLFVAALERYIDQRAKAILELTAKAESGRDKIAAVLAFYVDASSGDRGRVGCMVVETAVELSVSDPDLAARITAQQSTRRAQLERFIREGRADGSVSTSVDPPLTAELLLMITQGMRIAGKSGSASNRMQRLADHALQLLD